MGTYANNDEPDEMPHSISSGSALWIFRKRNTILFWNLLEPVTPQYMYNAGV